MIITIKMTTLTVNTRKRLKTIDKILVANRQQKVLRN